MLVHFSTRNVFRSGAIYRVGWPGNWIEADAINRSTTKAWKHSCFHLLNLISSVTFSVDSVVITVPLPCSYCQLV
jgi:hypothetical protein